LQGEAKPVVGAPALPDMPEILIAERIVPQQITLIESASASSASLLPIGQSDATRHTCSFFKIRATVQDSFVYEAG
jgi:hypothetical protein